MDMSGLQSLNATHATGKVAFALIKDEYKIWSLFVMLSHDAISSHPLKQWIALNLIQYRVATSVTLIYHTTITFNELSSHHFPGNLPCNATTETCLFLCSFIIHTMDHCFASKWSKCSIHFDHNIFCNAYSFHILLLKFVIKCISFIHEFVFDITVFSHARLTQRSDVSVYILSFWSISLRGFGRMNLP